MLKLKRIEPKIPVLLQSRYETTGAAVESEEVQYYSLTSYVMYDGYILAIHDDAPWFPRYAWPKVSDVLVSAMEDAIKHGYGVMSNEYVELIAKHLRRALRKGDRGYADVYASLVHRLVYAYGVITPLLLTRGLGITDVTLHVNAPLSVESYKLGSVATNIEVPEEERRRWLLKVISRWAAPVSSYMPFASQVDQRFNIRVTASTHPISPQTTIAFRVFGVESWTPPRYVHMGGAAPHELALLWHIWVHGMPGAGGAVPIFVIGKPGTGKTTLVDAIIATTPPNQPLAVVESVQEIKAPQARVRLVERQSFTSDIPSVRMARLIQLALRMSVPYVATNEVLGPADAKALLQAATIGMRTITTLHAATPRDLVERLKALGVPKTALDYLTRRMLVVLMEKEGVKRRLSTMWLIRDGREEEVPKEWFYLPEIQVKAKILHILAERQALWEPENWVLFLRDFYADPQKALAAVAQYE
ncbi:MAG: ATPase, T2SS/T4P/T4SS family [Pyrobaculum sp.]|uniref:ATPase, T2SS/T4P/T4SS family n=1 Tax=Pyrobaculum sp. TaxID=2004705 RepID=UPI003162AE00